MERRRWRRSGSSGVTKWGTAAEACSCFRHHTGGSYSFRGRAGYLVTPELQIYATGGAAAQKVSATLVCSNTGAAGCVGAGVTSTSSATRWGYTVGGGIEWKVWNNVLVRGEYRYNDYGTWKQSAFTNQIEEFADVHLKSHMLTFSIAYLFGPLGR